MINFKSKTEGNPEMKIKFITVLLIAMVSFIAMTSCEKTEESRNVSPALSTDLSKHPLYSKYKFNNTENIINLGTQPLYMPTGLITEAMKRDNILKNALKELGMEIRFHAFLKGSDLNFFFTKGDLDAGIAGDMPTITIASTSEVIIPAMIQQGFVSIVADHHMFINELKGRRIGYTAGSNAHYALLNVLSSAGLKDTDLKLIPMDVSEMPEALKAGKIDAFSAWEPTPFLTTKKYPDKTVIHRSLSTGYLYFSRSLFEKHPEAVKQILAAELRAFKWIKFKRDNLLMASRWTINECSELSEELSELSDVEVGNLALNDILGRSLSPVIPLTFLLRTERLYREFEFLKELGMIPPSIDWEKVHASFDRQILLDVFADSSGYSLKEFHYDIDRKGNE